MLVSIHTSLRFSVGTTHVLAWYLVRYAWFPPASPSLGPRPKYQTPEYPTQLPQRLTTDPKGQRSIPPPFSPGERIPPATKLNKSEASKLFSQVRVSEEEPSSVISWSIIGCFFSLLAPAGPCLPALSQHSQVGLPTGMLPCCWASNSNLKHHRLHSCPNDLSPRH